MLSLKTIAPGCKRSSSSGIRCRATIAVRW
jgi:hypothetical protein